MDYNKFNALFPLFEEKKCVKEEDDETENEDGEDEDEEDAPSFPKKTSVELEPEEEYIDHTTEIR